MAVTIFVPGVVPLGVPFTVSTQVETPEHAPLQPENICPALGAAVSVILVPLTAEIRAMEPTVMIPEGELEIVPAPVPAIVI